MKRLTPRQTALTLTVIAASLSPGCSSTPSDTQRGAAGGAALGAVAGAIIGNNRGSGNAASGAAIGAAAGAVAGGALGRRSDRQRAAASTYGYEDGAVTNIYVDGGPPLPPAPLAESVTAQPTSEAVWIPGYWSFESGDRYEWVSGHWEIPPRGARSYQPPQWRRQGNGSVYVRGYWR
jgi:uncharacterized protein YcfJ